MPLVLEADSVATVPSELWYTRCPVPTISGVALYHGWLAEAFADRSIALKSIRGAADLDTRHSHFAHTHAAMFREGGNIPAIGARAAGQDTAVVALTWVDETQLILVRGDSPIRDASQLKGKRLGLPKHATQHVDFDRAMSLHGFVTALKLGGVSTDAVEFVDLPAPEFDLREPGGGNGGGRHGDIAALRAGEVDALYVKGAQGAALAAEGLRPILDINAEPDPLVRVNNGTPRPVTVNRDLAERHPEIVARYLAVLIQAARWAEDHPDEVVSVVAAETGTDASAVLRGYGPGLHRTLHPTLRADWIDALGAQKDFLHEWGFVADFDLRSWIRPEPFAIARELAAGARLF